MKARRGVEVQPYPFFNPGAIWEWANITLLPVNSSTGGWMGLGASLNRCGKSRPRRSSNPELSAHTKLIKQV